MHSDERREFIAKTLVATAGLSLPLGASAQASDAQPQNREPGAEPTWLVVYSPGPNWPQGKTLAELPLRPHGRYMLQLYRDGKLRWAGGFADNSGGAAAFRALDENAATAVAKNDPAVLEGLFSFSVRRWNLVDWAAVDQRSQAQRP